MTKNGITDQQFKPIENKSAGLMRRLIAYLLDLIPLYLWAIILFAASMGLNNIIPFHGRMAESYVLRHLISFLTLSLPVLLWFWWWESGSYQATPGKRLMRIRVQVVDDRRAIWRSVLLRNLLKFLPWEVVHLTLHIYPDFFTTGDMPAIALISGLVLPQAIVLAFLGIVLIRPDRRSPYDLASGTRVVRAVGSANHFINGSRHNAYKTKTGAS